VGGWKDLLLDVLKLTDEVKRVNTTVDRLQATVNDVDKRVVRLETIVEMAKHQEARQIDNQ
jgi:hypothetical protein